MTKCRYIVEQVWVAPEDYPPDIVKICAQRLGISPGRVSSATVVRRSIDARRRPVLVLSCMVEVDGDVRRPGRNCRPAPEPRQLPSPPRAPEGRRVVVVGAGPAGLFGCLRLCEAGLRPILIERGQDISPRRRAVSRLVGRGELDSESNFHFGMGGAGAFSDGKLFTRLHNPWVRWVLEKLVEFGAGSEDEILVDAHPHVGTDRWPGVLRNFKKKLAERGVEFSFATRIDGIQTNKGRLRALRTTRGEIGVDAALVAPGNSARDLFTALMAAGVKTSPKPMAVGFRLAHPQSLIDEIQFGRWAGHPALGPATYRLATKAAGRPVYSFCMCPGGLIVPTPTEPEGLCTNGMSPRRRNGPWANAAIVVGVGPADYGGEGPLAGVEFQRRIEKIAYRLGGGGFRAPAARLVDFLEGKGPGDLPDIGYRPGLRPARLEGILPETVEKSLREGLERFCRSMPRFRSKDAVLVAAETRTSGPVRFGRAPDGSAEGVEGLFLAGEGSGLAGGIISAAIDGIRQADALIRFLREKS